MMNYPSKDPYQTLGLSHDASPSEIRRAYQKLALKYHPDRNKNVSASANTNFTENNKEEKASNSDEVDFEEKMAEINEAYGILKDEEQKRRYDYLYKFGGARGQSSRFTPDRTETETAAAAAQPSRRRSQFRQRTHSYGRNNATDPFFQPSTHHRNQTQFSTRPRPNSTVNTASTNARSNGGGFSFTYSSTSTGYIPGTGDRTFTRKTTQFQNGTKYTHIETTTIRANGTTERSESSHCEENVTFLGHVVKSMLGGPNTTAATNSNAGQSQSTTDDRGDHGRGTGTGTSSQEGENSGNSEKLPWFSSLSDKVKKCVGCS